MNDVGIMNIVIDIVYNLLVTNSVNSFLNLFCFGFKNCLEVKVEYTLVFP